VQGFEILEELEEAVNNHKPTNTLQALSSKFYTAVPHDFGRRVPPVINTLEMVQNKYDMLAVSCCSGLHSPPPSPPPPPTYI
jgi:poly [ADP-ribose] polymerase